MHVRAASGVRKAIRPRSIDPAGGGASGPIAAVSLRMRAHLYNVVLFVIIDKLKKETITYL